MFLESTRRRNPALVEAAVRLHREGVIRPNTYVLDADRIAENARMTAEAARGHGLVANVMTKQYGRNPRVSQLIRDAGLTRFVAVDVDEARVLWQAGLDVAHVGHLVGLAASDVDEVIDHRPATVTVFNVGQARRLDEASGRSGHRQDVLLRMYDPAENYHPGQHGGFELADLDAALTQLVSLHHLHVRGVTTHPCLDYDYADEQVIVTGKLALLRAAAERISRAREGFVEINAPGITSITTMSMTKAEGATTVEPGSALTGSTPLHAVSDQPEVPSVVYVSEVSHRHGERAFTFGGGFYPRGRTRQALVVAAGQGQEAGSVLTAAHHPAEAIDYYGELDDPEGVARTGDTVVYAFRNQVFVARSRVAVVEGLMRDPARARVTGIYDSLGRLLDGA
jgi:predicted amino acid racemase